MPGQFLDLFGAVVNVSALEATKARAVAEFLSCDVVASGAHLIELRQRGGLSSVIVEVDVELGQQPKRDIHRKELLGVVFDKADKNWPEVLALRPDFPRDLPHLNLRPPGWPPSLCLSDQPYEEAKRRWTPARYVEEIRSWLSLTARDELHRDDQPVEPFLLDFKAHIIVPHRLLSCDGEAPKLLYGYACSGEKGPKGTLPVYRLCEQPVSNGTVQPGLVATILTLPPREHGVIHHSPGTLAELTTLVDAENFDLLRSIKDRLIEWKGTPATLDAHPVLLLRFPIKRHVKSSPERQELWAFLLDAMVRQLGERLDLWQMQDGKLGTILRPDPTKRGTDVAIELLNPHLTLSRVAAAELSRLEKTPFPGVVAVGAGALGSQVLMNLTRLGWAASAIIDNDHLLPHNLARHALIGDYLGWPKAHALAHACRLVLDEEPTPEPLAINVLLPEDQAQSLTAKFHDADLILDMSASVAVARHLAIDIEATVRRVSLFLSPSGSDLVLLAEDKDRVIQLDELEMQYYWAIATREELSHHLEAPDRVRYAHSCRDLSNRISQAAIAIHAGIGAEALRKVAIAEEAAAWIWRLDERNCTVSRIALDIYSMRHAHVAEWTVVLGNGLVEDVFARRAEKLPNETGGVLIGECDMERRRIYLVGSIAAPPDSVEWPTAYIRGSRGLRKQVELISKRTNGMLQYVGEWHSHPQGVSSRPSPEDHKAYARLTEEMAVEGYPPVMLIAADGAISVIVAAHRADWC